MDALAVIVDEPRKLRVGRLALTPPESGDIVVDVAWSGISTGTERLLWSGRMPPFPGLGYPLVPGYESVGRVADANGRTDFAVGDMVYVPGARCFGPVRGLFGGSASRLVVSGDKVVRIDAGMGETGTLLALAATAHHALALGGLDPAGLPDLIVGHGVLGRLLARLAVALGGAAPTVWETNAGRMDGAQGYAVTHPDQDERRDYRHILDVSGDSTILDRLIARQGPGGRITLAGFYEAPVAFTFPPAFLRETRIAVAAEWKQPDLLAVRTLIETGRLDLDGLITHRRPANAAPDAYRTAFEEPACLKMILDWKEAS